MTSPLENLAGPSGPLSAEPPDEAETAGLLRPGRVRLADAGNAALSLEYEGHMEVEERLVLDVLQAGDAVASALP